MTPNLALFRLHMFWSPELLFLQVFRGRLSLTMNHRFVDNWSSNIGERKRKTENLN